ncbi:hypothetical protein A9Q88_00760 [Gammaproteobacteria bacterium 50_400_T64]|nr:hypothetical protein A9Q88_00760 [Gammaproteobacteria bacterium 50_400_T64]
MQDDIAILSAWSFSYDGKSYYTSQTHYHYIKEITKYCRKVWLIVPVKNVTSIPLSQVKIEPVNINVIALPYFETYLGGVRNIYKIIRAILKVKGECDNFYARVPDPLCWMPWFLRCRNVTMHFVGSSVHATWHSTLPIWTKICKLVLYLPEYLMTLLAAKFCNVYVNGSPIHKVLMKYKIKSTVVISSTITIDNILEEKPEYSDCRAIRLLYVGYLRPAKGVEKIVSCLPYLEESGIDYHLDIVGSGVSESRLQQMVSDLGLCSKVTFHGHIDDKAILQCLYNNSDMFLFMSSSEGSPRVVLEAIAAQNIVITTPVGSLPSIFSDEREILFVDPTSESLAKKIIHVLANHQFYLNSSLRAQAKVRDSFLLPKFIKQVFLNDA